MEDSCGQQGTFGTTDDDGSCAVSAILLSVQKLIERQEYVETTLRDLVAAVERSTAAPQVASSDANPPEPTESAGLPFSRGALMPRTRSLDHLGPNVCKFRSSELCKFRSQEFSQINRLPRCDRGIPFLHPHSGKRTIVDAVGVALLLYDMVMIPYFFAWNIPRTPLQRVVDWIALGFWTLDIFISFHTGVELRGKVLMDRGVVCRSYIKGSLFPDLAVVLSDWIAASLYFMVSGSVGKWETIFSILRVLKLNRLMRVMSFLKRDRFSKLYDRVLLAAMLHGIGSTVELAIKLFLLVTGLLWWAHLGCCLWYVIARSAGEGSGWNAFLFEDGVYVGGASNGVWLVGMYWSISTMFAGASPYEPTSTIEFCFACTFVILGVLIGGLIISYLTKSTMSIILERSAERKKLKDVDRFLKQHEVVGRLAVGIHKQIKHQGVIQRTRDLSMKDVSALSGLTPKLRSELHYAICLRIFRRHPFFNVCIQLKASLMRQVSSFAVFSKAFRATDIVFMARSPAEAAYVVSHGSFTYAQTCRTFGTPLRIQSPSPIQSPNSSQSSGPSSSPSPSVRKAEIVVQGQWISELALWTTWSHQGTLEANGDSEVLEVSASSFQEVLAEQNHPEIETLVWHYTNAHIRAVHTEMHGALSDTDHVLGHEQLVFSTMPLDMRVLMSKPWLNLLRKKHGGLLFRKGAFEDLEEEVTLGNCDLVTDCGGRMLRVVPLVLLRILRGDGCVLVQLGKLDGDSFKATTKLPSLNMSAGELPHQTLRRLCRELTLPDTGISICNRKVTAKESNSLRYIVRTNYIETIFSAVISAGFDFGTPFPIVISSSNSHEDISAVVVPSASQASKALLCAWMQPRHFEDLSMKPGFLESLEQQFSPEWHQRHSKIVFKYDASPEVGQPVERWHMAAWKIQVAFRGRQERLVPLGMEAADEVAADLSATGCLGVVPRATETNVRGPDGSEQRMLDGIGWFVAEPVVAHP